MNAPPAAGSTAPEFTLPDDTGEPVSLSRLVSGNGVVLIFYRGLWCPFCLTQLTEYRDLLRLSRVGVPEIVALSADTVERSADLKRELGLPYRLLCDPEKQVIGAWGLLSPEKGGIAFNATFGLLHTRRIVFRSLDSMVSRASGERAIQAVIHPPEIPDPRPPRSWVIPSPRAMVQATWNAVRHGLGAPRAPRPAQ